MTFDDSALLVHASSYDPAKAHEYYMRNRKLKGRLKKAEETSSPRPPSGGRPATGGSGGKPNRADTKSRQAELRAEKERLEARLDRLRDVLSELVDAAKKRSGVKDPKKDDKSDDTSSTSKDKKGKDSKKEKLTESEKREKNKKAQEEYEKEHPTSLSTDVKELHAQIEDIQGKIKKALADARERRNKAGTQDGKSGSKNNNDDGPRGR